MKSVFFSAVILAFLASCQNRTNLPLSSTGSWISSFSLIDDSLDQAYSTTGLFYGTQDSHGNLYLNVTTQPSGWLSNWKIMRSTDHGATWSVVETSPSNYGVSYHIAADSLGNVFAVGAESSNGSQYSGVIRKFNGTSWSVVKTFQTEAGKSTQFDGVAVDSLDNIYVLGSGGVSTPVSSRAWVILKSTDHGSTWTPTNVFIPDDNNPCFGSDLIVTAADELYSSGYCAFGNGESFIRKSSDHGMTWSTVYETWDNQIASIAEWNHGIIFATNNQSGPNKGHVKVFHSQDNFGHLTEVYDSGEYLSGFVGSLKVDSRGYVYLSATYGDDYYGAGHGEIIATRDGTWETVELQTFTAGGASQWMNDIFFNDQDQVFYVGSYTESGATKQRIYRADLTSTTPWTPDALGNGSDKSSPIPAGAKIIYTTSAVTSGVLAGTPAGAIAAADALCNADAYKPTYASGTFKAMLVNSLRTACTTANCSGGSGEHVDWVLAANQAYVTRSGKTVGTTNTVGIFTSTSNALGTYLLEAAWTGLRVDPATDWTTDDWTCGNWTTNDWGSGWNPTGSDLSSLYPGGYWATCDNNLPLICVEQ